MKKAKHLISAGIFAFFLLIAFGSIDDDNKSNNKSVSSSGIDEKEMSSEKNEVFQKLKEKAKQDWPNDYTTQEFWVKEQLEAYDYMLKIDNNPIKSKAQTDWPLDFVTQKFWYNEQIKAKERIE